MAFRELLDEFEKENTGINKSGASVEPVVMKTLAQGFEKKQKKKQDFPRLKETSMMQAFHEAGNLKRK